MQASVIKHWTFCFSPTHTSGLHIANLNALHIFETSTGEYRMQIYFHSLCKITWIAPHSHLGRPFIHHTLLYIYICHTCANINMFCLYLRLGVLCVCDTTICGCCTCKTFHKCYFKYIINAAVVTVSLHKIWLHVQYVTYSSSRNSFERILH